MSDLIARDLYVDKLHRLDSEPAAHETVRILTGVRRSGKSSILRLYEESLIVGGTASEQIMRVDFEKLSVTDLRDPVTFHRTVDEAVKEQSITHLHVDEVQELDDWARTINSIRATHNLHITVTGSNASMFSGEGLTYLAGRYVTIPVYPLSLAEYQTFTDDSTGSPEELYTRWMRGTLPAVARTRDAETAERIINDTFDSIFTRDIAMRGQLRNVESFLKVARFVFDGAGSPISPGKISNVLDSEGISVSAQSVDRFLQLLVNAHMLYQCQRYDVRGREWLRTNGKYYFVDPGLRDTLLGHRNSNTGHDLENMVYLELLRRGYRVSTGTVQGGEIDFIAQSSDETLYIQVALTALDPQTLERELRPFDKTPPGADCILITMDRLPLQTGDVRQVNALDFLTGLPVRL